MSQPNQVTSGNQPFNHSESSPTSEKHPRRATSTRAVHYREGHYAIVPQELLTDPLLSHADKVMLMTLCSFAYGKSVLWPSRAAIGERAGLHESNVSKRIRRLVEFGWVTVTARGRRSNVYRLRLPARLLDGYQSPEVAAKPAEAADEITSDERYELTQSYDGGDWEDVTLYEQDDDDFDIPDECL